jgi:uncharacterized membrane-anchored protein
MKPNASLFSVRIGNMEKSEFGGRVKLDTKTKRLVKRLRGDEIAVINHRDLDRITAESLLETKVKIVVNADKFMSGRYPNIGPLLLARSGVFLYEAPPKIFEVLKEGDYVEIKEEGLYKDGNLLLNLAPISLRELEERFSQARKRLGLEMKKFSQNTLEFIAREGGSFFEDIKLPPLKTQLRGRHSLVVVRGYDYKHDLKILKSYIRDVRPVIIAVDGGADTLLDEGFKPDLIVGDMDSVSDEALKCGAELVVHAYPDGRAPGIERLKRLGLKDFHIFKAPGTSEDIALLLAYELGSELIVAVGTHFNIIEFLDKGREGMSSTFLTRLKVGEKLVDAKGVNKLYRSRVKISHFIWLFLATTIAFSAVLLASPFARNFVKLLVAKIRLSLGV